MKPKTRFIKSVVKAAREEDVRMPWTRGERRAEMIARREHAQRSAKGARLA